MQRRELQRKMYELEGRSMAQRLTLAGIAAVWVALAWWLLFAGGLAIAGGWFAWMARPRIPLCTTRGKPIVPSGRPAYFRFLLSKVPGSRGDGT
jgi:hypothetical protein